MTIKRVLLGLCAVILVQVSPVMAQGLYPLSAQPDGQSWPDANWDNGNLPTSATGEVSALVDDIMERELDDVMGETRAIVIIHKGKLVLERYRTGFGPDTRQLSWSMAKSLTSALVGRALAQGLISDIDAAMPGPWAADDPRSAISWRQWLNMTDGLEYHEIGEPDLAKNDVVQMMFGKGRYDAITYAGALPLAHEPGTHWNYSTAGFHLIARAVQGFVAQNVGAELPASEAMASYVEDSLFAPLGMDARIEFDPAGTFMGGSLVWASARDFARFGYLFLHDGMWGETRLLPEGWVDFSRTKTPADNASVYGAGWWINAADANDIRPAGHGSALGPRDAFSAQGHEGQVIWVVPSRDLVIVRLGLMSNGGENWPALYDWSQKLAMAFPEYRADTPH